MKSSPIYNIIDNPARASDCSFGARDRFTQHIQVGTSARNSHTLARIDVERRENEDGTVTFNLFIDGYLMRSGTLCGKSFTLEHKLLTQEVAA